MLSLNTFSDLLRDTMGLNKTRSCVQQLNKLRTNCYVFGLFPTKIDLLHMSLYGVCKVWNDKHRLQGQMSGMQGLVPTYKIHSLLRHAPRWWTLLFYSPSLIIYTPNLLARTNTASHHWGHCETKVNEEPHEISAENILLDFIF